MSLQAASTDKSATEFCSWLQSAAEQTVVVYPDGFLSAEGATAYGYATHMRKFTFLTWNGRLGPAECSMLEPKCAPEWLPTALTLSAPERIVVYLDTLALRYASRHAFRFVSA